MGMVFGRQSRRRQQRASDWWGISGPADLIPARSSVQGAPFVTNDTAMRNSAVWACLRLRNNIISTLPVDVYRYAQIEDNGEPLQIAASPTPFMTNPGGPNVPWEEWIYSSGVELDRTGNSIGIISQVDGAGFPAQIDLQPSASVTTVIRNGVILEYRIDNVPYRPDQIWHEKQYTVSGIPLGLSPVAYAAFTLGHYASIQDFATQWFSAGNGPRASLKNTQRKLDAREAERVKDAWRGSQSLGQPFVHGADWEYNLIQADQASSDWLDAMKYSVGDIARFFDCPPEMIYGATSGESVTYANVSERMLGFLVMNLGPAIVRREKAISRILPRPRFIKFNTDALLRMDSLTKAQAIETQINSRVLAPSEARRIDNRQPFTPAQMREFDYLGLNKVPSAPGTPKPQQPAPPPGNQPPNPPPDNEPGQGGHNNPNDQGSNNGS